jgi:uncharacterized RDD family membrane protein YckC
MTNPYAPPSAAVYDVADRSGQFVPADRGTRLGAQILDSLIAFVMVYVPFLIGVAIMGPAEFATSDELTGAAMGAFALGVLGLIAWMYLTVLYVNRNGQSIAKRMLGIKVVRSDGSRASLARIFWLRNVVNIIISVIPLYGIVDSLFIFSESRQCIHDKIADTIVVNA